MPFTVDDFQDLIRLLAQRPEWRAELRRHVLSDELLELPAIVRQLADQLVEAQARTDQRLERVESVLERLAEAQGRTETRVGRLEGEVLELRYARRAPAYLSRLAHGSG
jgi:phage shock protein A